MTSCKFLASMASFELPLLDCLMWLLLYLVSVMLMLLRPSLVDAFKLAPVCLDARERVQAVLLSKWCISLVCWLLFFPTSPFTCSLLLLLVFERRSVCSCLFLWIDNSLTAAIGDSVTEAAAAVVITRQPGEAETTKRVEEEERLFHV